MALFPAAIRELQTTARSNEMPSSAAPLPTFRYEPIIFNRRKKRAAAPPLLAAAAAAAARAQLSESVLSPAELREMAAGAVLRMELVADDERHGEKQRLQELSTQRIKGWKNTLDAGERERKIRREGERR